MRYPKCLVIKAPNVKSCKGIGTTVQLKEPWLLLAIVNTDWSQNKYWIIVDMDKIEEKEKLNKKVINIKNQTLGTQCLPIKRLSSSDDRYIKDLSVKHASAWTK